MASYTTPTSFGFMDRYAGFGEDDAESDRLDLEQKRLNVEHARRAAAREDESDEYSRLRLEITRNSAEESRRKKKKYDGARSLFNEAFSEMKAAPEGELTPAKAALDYVHSVDSVRNAVKAGDMSKAYALYKSGLDDPERKWSERFFVLGGLQPDDNNELALQTGAANFRKRAFDEEPIKLPDGTVTTLGEQFRDGETWKTTLGSMFSRHNMSTEVAAAYQSDDPFTRSVMRSIMDPGLMNPRDPSGFLDERNDFGDFMARNMAKYRDMLGDNGVLALVSNATNKHLGDKTYKDMAEVVYRSVEAQRLNGDETQRVYGPSADASVQVRDALSQYEQNIRLATVPGTNKVDAETAQAVSEFMVWGADAGVTNFGDKNVRAAMGSLTSFYNVCTQLNIPLFAQTYTAGADIRRASGTVLAAAQNGTLVPEDNFFVDASNGISLSLNFLSGGTQPARASRPGDRLQGFAGVAGATTGNALVDSALLKMAGTLVGDYMLPAAANRSGDPRTVLMSALSDGELREKWAKTVGISLSLSPATARTVVDKYIADAMGETGVHKANLLDTISRLADPKAKVGSAEEDAAQAELQRFLQAESLGDQMFADQDVELTRHLMDPVVGLGLKSMDQVRAYIHNVNRKEAEHVRLGTGVGSAHDAAMNVGTYYDQARNTLPGGVVAGRVMLPDGSAVYVVPRAGKDVVSKQPGFKGFGAQYGLVLEGDRSLKDAIPVLTPQRADLRRVSLGSLLVGAMQLPAVPAGLWSQDPDAFRKAMAERKALYDAVTKGTSAAAQGAAKESGKGEKW